MAAPKRQRLDLDGDNDFSHSGSSDGDSDQDNFPLELINVDFEAYAANDGDFHGIKQLLLQLFLKAHIDSSQFSELLIQQNYVTSVLKNATAIDMDDDDDSENFVFGLVSTVNITRQREVECIKQLKEYLFQKCQRVCSPEDFDYFKGILDNKEKHIGLIFNERLVNIPAQVSLPLFEALKEDIDAANLCQGEKKFNFTNFLLISKIHSNSLDMNGLDDYGTVTYVNSEEEYFAKEASFTFTYLVSDEKDTGLDGSWEDDDVEWLPGRQVMLIPADKLETLVAKLKEEFS